METYLLFIDTFIIWVAVTLLGYLFLLIQKKVLKIEEPRALKDSYTVIVFFFIIITFFEQSLPVTLWRIILSFFVLYFYCLFKNKMHDLVVSISAVIVAIASMIFTFIISQESLNIMNLDLESSNKPLVVLSNKFFSDYRTTITLWNAGPGVAYDIYIEVHLADINTNMGSVFASNVVKAALELETKSKNELINNINSGYSKRIYFNHPKVLPPGMESGYESSNLSFPVLTALFVIINYADVNGNKYFSTWDGYEWNFGDGSTGNLKPTYKGLSPVVGYYSRILNALHIEQDSFRNLHIVDPKNASLRWLIKEAEYLKLNGFGDYYDEFNSYNIQE